MSRVATLDDHGTNGAIVLPGGRTISYADLAARADALAARLPSHRSLGIVRCSIGVGTLVAYLAALRHGHTVVLVDGSAEEPGATGGPAAHLAQRFEAEWIVDPAGVLTLTGHEPATPIDPRAGVLLPTSGTTGSPKHVVLSSANLDANAASIADYLDIGPDERPLTSLPFHYSYGLSVVNSHLLKGATLLLTDEPITARPFWSHAEAFGATSLAGVPTHYQVLLRLGLERLWVPTLRTLTQAGGALPASDVVRVADVATARKARFFVMYGQTEATARMAYLPPEHLPDHAGSVGRAIPGGEFRLVDGDGRTIDPAGVEGELVYRGPNVMQGYATERSELAELSPPDELRTGDLAVRDDLGLYRITGRLKRMIKIRGHRVGLDELERVLADAGHEVICGGGDDRLVVGHRPSTDASDLEQILARRCRIPAAVMTVVALDAWPTTVSGKIDYRELAAVS